MQINLAFMYFKGHSSNDETQTYFACDLFCFCFGGGDGVKGVV